MNAEATPEKWQVNIEGFSGPLDLLVHLIADKKMDIFTVNIAGITDEFLQAVKQQETKNLDLAGEYLVLAATLIRYKSRSLLPKDESEPEDEELSDHLLELRQKEYERFRELAEDLREREEKSSSIFPRIGSSPEGPHEVIEYGEVSIFDLHRTFVKILEEIGDKDVKVIEGESFSVDEKILEIEALLSHNEHVILADYLRTLRSKLEIIVVFLAVLEMVKLHEIKVLQDRHRGGIVIEKDRAYTTIDDLDNEEPEPSPDALKEMKDE